MDRTLTYPNTRQNNMLMSWSRLVQDQRDIFQCCNQADNLIKNLSQENLILFFKDVINQLDCEKNTLFLSYFLNKKVSVLHFKINVLKEYRECWQSLADKIQGLVEKNTQFSGPCLFNLIQALEKSENKETIFLIGEKLKIIASKKESPFQENLFLFHSVPYPQDILKILHHFFPSFESEESFDILCNVYKKTISNNVKNLIEKLAFATKHDQFFNFIMKEYNTESLFFQKLLFFVFLTENIEISKKFFKHGALLDLSDSVWNPYLFSKISTFFEKNIENKEILTFPFKNHWFKKENLEKYLPALEKGLFFEKNCLHAFLQEGLNYAKILENMNMDTEDVLFQFRGETKETILSFYVLSKALGSRVDPLIKELNEKDQKSLKYLKKVFDILDVDWQDIIAPKKISDGNFFRKWELEVILSIDKIFKNLQAKHPENYPVQTSSDEESNDDDETSLEISKNPLKRKFPPDEDKEVVKQI